MQLLSWAPGRRVQRMPCVTDDRRVVFVESDTLTWDFNSGSEAFDFLATGETLILTYTGYIL